MRSLERSGRPTAQVAESERDPGRAAHSHVAMHDDSLGVGPALDEAVYLTSVLGAEEDVRRIARFNDVVEMESKHRHK